jgi:hypothetical protein
MILFSLWVRLIRTSEDHGDARNEASCHRRETAKTGGAKRRMERA